MKGRSVSKRAQRSQALDPRWERSNSVDSHGSGGCHASVDRGRSSLVARVRQHAPDVCGGEIDGDHHRCREVHCGPAARRPFRTSAKRENRRRGRNGDDQRQRQLCRPESRSGQLRGRDRRHRRKDCRHERDCHRRRGKHCVVDGHGSLDRARWRYGHRPCRYSRRRRRRWEPPPSSWPPLETRPARPNSQAAFTSAA